MLFQAADNEFLGMVGSHTALRQIGTPSDLYIFPNEDHIKSQPAHRLAIYRRNLAWFNFWLRDEFAQDPAQKEEVARWVKRRDEWTNPPPRSKRAEESRLFSSEFRFRQFPVSNPTCGRSMDPICPSGLGAFCIKIG